MCLQTFFVAHTGIHIPTLHEMCIETLNPHIGTVLLTVTYRLFLYRVFLYVYFTSVLFWRTIR